MTGQVGTDKQTFDKVSAIVIEAFNQQGLLYGRSSRHSYPVKWEDVFSEPVSGGSARPHDECRAILAYVLANHIPLFDPMRDALRLATNIYIAAYLNRARNTCDNMIGTGCRLIKVEEYRNAYHRGLIECQKQGVELWNVGKAIRLGNCQQ